MIFKQKPEEGEKVSQWDIRGEVFRQREEQLQNSRKQHAYMFQKQKEASWLEWREGGEGDRR